MAALINCECVRETAHKFSSAYSLLDYLLNAKKGKELCTSSSRYRTVTLVVVELIQTLASIQTRTTGTLIDVKLTCWSSVTRETSTDVAAILRNTLAAIITRISEAVVDKLTLSLIWLKHWYVITRVQFYLESYWINR